MYIYVYICVSIYNQYGYICVYVYKYVHLEFGIRGFFLVFPPFLHAPP